MLSKIFIQIGQVFNSYARKQRGCFFLNTLYINSFTSQNVLCYLHVLDR